MRELSLYETDNLDQLPIDTFILYGDTGTGKTTCSAGFPRPLFLADESEGGWKSLRGLADDQLFEPDVDPLVWGIKEMNDVATALNKIPPLVVSGRVRTVIISSITFYAQTYLAHLQRNDPGIDTRQLYGSLAVHLREVRTRFHALGVNIIWEALADHPETGDGKSNKTGRPKIAGQSADMFAAGVSYLFRCTLDDVREGGKVVDRVLKIFTQNTGGYISRPRIGKAAKQLPNPLLGGYRGFVEALGYDFERLRRSLPPIPKVTTTAPKVASPPSGAKATTNK